MSRLTRLFGTAVVTVGALVILLTLTWVVAYFVERRLDPVALRAAFGDQLMFWLPVFLFNVPGLLLVGSGRRLRQGARLDLFEWISLLALLVLVGVTVAMVFAPCA